MSLNPNAAEFVPSKIKSLPRNDRNAQSSSLDDPISLGKEILDQSFLNASDYSDDEARKFWLHQLPDDITPDFKATQEELQIASDPSLLMDGLSINNGIESSQFSVAGTKHLSKRQDVLSVNGATDNRSGLGYSRDSSPWSKQFENGNQNNGISGVLDKVNSNEFLNDLLFDCIDLNNASLKPLEFFTAKFPIFSADCIANAYLRNQCDLKSTMIYLAQIELQLQDEHSFIQNPNSKMLSDAHKGSFKYGHDDGKRGPSAYRLIDKGPFLFNKHKPSDTSRGALGFAAVHKFGSQNLSHRAYERNCSPDMNTGSSINSQLVTKSYNGHLKSMYMDKLQDNVCSESREEPHSFGLPDNASFDQARPAFIFDNEAFARDILQLKATNDSVRENIFRQRNPAFHEDQYHGWCAKDPLINLHGLQLIEAMHVLSLEVNTLRMMARSAGQRVQVLVLIGNVLHTNGTLPEDAIKQYLLEEGLQFSQPQSGLIRLMVC